MQEFLDKFDFQIILKSEEVGESSIYWQKQCLMFFDSIRKNLPECSIHPLNRKGGEGEKTVDILSYDSLTLAGMTLSSFHALLKLINVWERNRKKANVKLINKNGIAIDITNLSVDEALEIYKNLQQEDE